MTSVFFKAPKKEEPPPPSEPTRAELIRDAAMKCFARQGVAATTLREIAEEAHVSVGAVQHHFGNKATKTALVEAVDEHVLKVFGTVAETVPTLDPLPARESMDGVAGRFARLFTEHPDVMDYVAHALVEGGTVGAIIFDGLLKISEAQRDLYTAHDLARPGLDPLWGALNAMILRVGAMILRPHIDRYLPEPFSTPEQLERWDKATSLLVRKGQFREGYDRDDA